MQLKWYGEEVKEALNDELRVRLDEVSDAIALQAQTNCPVKTGKLQESITYYLEDTELTSHIGSEVIYAPFIEFGTRRMQAQPYLRKAAYEIKIEGYFKDILEKR